ncbi:1,4-alpha-glucan branching protein GlgB [Nocardioides pocheonensis]|uniref:1,4-alpha-glucan branching enzyme GlgB n=1 Tax=Nocardioides pocheonensis TaxID=661485 RepID=A0A3N0GGI1_9ACTN|nr:1,4-alpha-glucan branching protein GlgB [Nocardioides pocheonensis]RNM11541.1 1,4-alpha-glucan branching protein GlgB [Nocardioides pocheonensis]
MTRPAPNLSRTSVPKTREPAASPDAPAAPAAPASPTDAPAAASPAAPTAPVEEKQLASPLGDLDLHLIGEGRHFRLWEALGAQVEEGGVRFSVWAPNAREVRLIGDFNGWDRSTMPMSRRPESGVWELVVPGVKSGARYKFVVAGADGQWRDKADPMAQHTGVPPEQHSVVFESKHTWTDDAWMAQRPEMADPARPMSVYEVHLGSWRKHLDGSWYGYDALADALVEYVVEMGFTHVEFLPVMEHPFGGSWGYQVTSYYAPTSRFGDPDGFRRLVDRLHQAGIGVILDWVPAHFPKDDFALARFDGTPLYEDPNPLRGEHPDWGTLVFNFGRLEVRNFLIANALYWMDEFHIDALRVDAVASMLYLDYSRGAGQWSPNVHGGRENLEAVAFLQDLNRAVDDHIPGGLVIAEESTSWPGVTAPTSDHGLGFALKWNMGWMHDSLSYIQRDPMYRSHHHGQLTFSLVYAWSERYVLPISHDEVVHGKGSLLRKMPGDRWKQFAGLRAFLAYQWAHPGKQLLFMGTEFGQDGEWAESRELDWWSLQDPDHEGVSRLVRDLNATYKDSRALWTQDHIPGGFTWLIADDAASNVIAFVRWGNQGEALVCVCNFSGMPHENYRLPLPFAGDWNEVVNTDATAYAGSGVGNLGTVTAHADPYHGQPASATLRLPPLATLWLTPSAG